MFRALRRTARERYTRRRVLLTAAVVAVLAVVERDALVPFAAVVLVAEPIALLRETPAVDDRWVRVALGSVAALVGLAWFAHRTTLAPAAEGATWVPLLPVAGGVWLLLDARRDLRDGRRPDRSSRFDDLSASEAMLVTNHASLVGRELKTGPKTVPELAEACDLTESRVREALAVATTDDTVYRLDEHDHGHEHDSRTDPGRCDEKGDGGGAYSGRYALDESKIGGVAFVRENGRRVVRRLVRPFR